MPSNTLRTILLKGQAQGKRREATCNAAITPGHLCEYMSTGNIRVHALAAGAAYPLFAAENELFGNEITVAYAANDRGLFWHATPGDEINALVPAAAAAIVIGDYLESNGDGTLKKAVDLTGAVGAPIATGILADVTAAFSQTVLNNNFATIAAHGQFANAVAVAMEAVDNSAGGAVARIRVMVL